MYSGINFSIVGYGTHVKCQLNDFESRNPEYFKPIEEKKRINVQENKMNKNQDS